jgi:hypothetical protein
VTRSGARRGRALLRWAITGKLPLIGYVTVPDTAPLLSQAQLARLRDRTAASLALGSPRAADARAGAELPALSGAPRPVVRCPRSAGR